MADSLTLPDDALCLDVGPDGIAQCLEPQGHPGPHAMAETTWSWGDAPEGAPAVMGPRGTDPTACLCPRPDAPLALDPRFCSTCQKRLPPAA